MDIVLKGKFCFSEAPWLTWSDIKYGLNNGFISSAGVVEYAIEGLSIESPADQYELACLPGGDIYGIQNCVDRLADGAELGVHSSEKAWIFLTLLWVFRNRDAYPDPLGVVEELYADFGYPESVAPIVRYMPPADPDLVGEDELFRKWPNILEFLRKELQLERSGQII